ncbi:hypothetical protein [Haloferula sp. A504]|uniref:hypothetical protein n=1 Tax=Haloferula sp. A504 TaxID=3373601 RepID=UPI0031BFB2A1|nr:hypothetical protein [Verrucomicrobiaceae bacterium E54]
MDIFLRSGICGLLIILCFVILVVTAAILIPLTRSRRVVGVLALLAFLPILLGLCGTWLGYRQVDAVIDAAVEAGQTQFLDHPQGVVACGRQEARYSSYLGAGATAALLVIAGIASVVTRPPSSASPPSGA